MDYKEIYNQDYFSGKNSFFYKLGYDRCATAYFNSMFRQVTRYLKKIKEGKVLDIGCAHGFMLERFPESFLKFGLDVSEYAIGIARKRLPKSIFRVGEAEDNLPFEKDFFDVVLLNDIIEHLENPALALDNTSKVLKKGGILYITTPNLNTFRKKFLKYADAKEHHISLFSHVDFMKLLAEVGFKVLERWTFCYLFFYLRFESNIGIESAFICTK